MSNEAATEELADFSHQRGAYVEGTFLSDRIETFLSRFIVIPKLDLPAIELCGCSDTGLLMKDECWDEGAGDTAAKVAWEKALEHIAHWNYIESGAVANTRAEEPRDQRRNELAKEFYGYPYTITPNSAQALINRIIELEASK